ncbi:hypothetical protein ACU686_10850 [Yinghuangia aomiensis]
MSCSPAGSSPTPRAPTGSARTPRDWTVADKTGAAAPRHRQRRSARLAVLPRSLVLAVLTAKPDAAAAADEPLLAAAASVVAGHT